MAQGQPATESSSTTSNPKLVYDEGGQALYNLVSFFEGYDQQVLSMCMRAFELTLGFSQSQLSMLASVSTMSRMGCCLIWGLLADMYEPNHVLGAGLLLIGIASIFLSSASHYKIIVFLRFLHGFAFACVYPVQHKIVANSDKSDKASLIFGIMQGLNCVGRLICAVITTLIARKVLLGYYGWRTSYVVLGYVWILFGVLILFGLRNNGAKTASKTIEDCKKGIAEAFSKVFGSPTAWISLFTIFIAEAPMCAFNYMTIYLQYLGVSDTMAGVAIAITLIGGAAGSGAGGEVIDQLGKKVGGYGELSSGCVVMIIRLIVCLLFFLGPAPNGRLLWYHYVELATLGATLVTVSSVDRAIMKNAVNGQYEATAAAIVRTISGIASSVILFQISAYLTEKVFGYVPSRESFETMATDIKERNAEALRKSMMYIIVAGAIINIVFYMPLFHTYPPIKEQIVKKNEEEKEKKTQELQQKN